MRFHAQVVMEENLGITLRRAREASDLTVDDAVYRARLPRAVVEALEADDFGYFTSPLYARSFLRQYGDYVGVDVSPWIDDLVPTALIDSESAESFLDLSDPAPAAPARETEKAKSSGGGAVAAVWMILITGGLVWGGMEIFKSLDARLSPPASAPLQVAAADPTPPEAVPEEDPEAPVEKPVAATSPETPKRAIIVDLPEEE